MFFHITTRGQCRCQFAWRSQVPMTDFACRVGFALQDLVSSVTETLEHGPAASSVTDFACRVGFAPVTDFACGV